MSKLGLYSVRGKSFSMYLEPIIDVRYNIVSGSFAALSHREDSELKYIKAFFMQLTSKESLWIATKQANIFFKISQFNPLFNKIFIKINLDVLLKESDFWRFFLPYINNINIAFEIDFMPSIILMERTETLSRNLLALAALNIDLWLRGDFYCMGPRIIKEIFSGIKIDRLSFLTMSNKKKPLKKPSFLIEKKVIVEGINSREHIDGIKAWGIEFAQGAYFMHIHTMQDVIELRYNV